MPIADLLAGMNLAYGVVAALHERHRTGRGRVVRTSLLAGVVGVHAFQGTRWTIAGEVPGLSGSHHPAIAPYGLFATATSPVQVCVASEGLWRTFARAVGLDPDDERFRTNRERVAHREDLIDEIEAHLRAPPRPSTGWTCSSRPACRPARCAPSTTSTPGSRPGRRGCCSRSTTRRTAG